MEVDISKIKNGYLISKRDDTADYEYKYTKYAFNTWDEVITWISNNPVS